MTILNLILILALLGTSIRFYYTLLLYVVSTYIAHWISAGLSFVFSRIGTLRTCILYVKNNANLHRTHNNRLALLNTMSLTFIIFAACLLRLQSNTLYANIQLSIPSDLLITSSSSLDETSIKEFLSQSKNRQYINNYEFLGSPITTNASLSQSLTTYADYQYLSPTVYFLDSNYLQLMWISVN